MSGKGVTIATFAKQKKSNQCSNGLGSSAAVDVYEIAGKDKLVCFDLLLVPESNESRNGLRFFLCVCVTSALDFSYEFIFQNVCQCKNTQQNNASF